MHKVLSRSHIQADRSTLRFDGSQEKQGKSPRLTDCRPGEALGLKWEESAEEEDGTVWTLPEERSKNGMAHRRFLTPTAREILERRRERCCSLWLLTRRAWKGSRFRPASNRGRPGCKAKPSGRSARGLVAAMAPPRYLGFGTPLKIEVIRFQDPNLLSPLYD